MPIYEYLCSKCNTKFEELRPLSEAEDKATCPQCQSEAERIPSCFNSRSTGDYGETVPIGGSPCSACSADSCTTCDL